MYGDACDYQYGHEQYDGYDPECGRQYDDVDGYGCGDVEQYGRGDGYGFGMNMFMVTNMNMATV